MKGRLFIMKTSFTSLNEKELLILNGGSPWDIVKFVFEALGAYQAAKEFKNGFDDATKEWQDDFKDTIDRCNKYILGGF